MKLFIAVLAFVVALACAQENDSKYTTRYDTINLDEILKSDRLFKNYFKCLIEEGSCTAEGKYLKTILPEALETNCAKCSEKQHDDGIRAIKYMTEHWPAEWKQLKAKYDPENIYVDRYLEKAEKAEIKL
ncbi:ejaculatory bulb-specific protein 3-like [Uranotaenia lowii]|uniref:ejaculatory bulb-specific protein 3-like n=1 Tax=Uranotaenia lowii TaxID=190385 RepID=UPI002479A151|nr:ejaculatory bulb-specific protein 3-like [Uranotaenia lowii]